MLDSKKYTWLFFFILLLFPSIIHAQSADHLVVSEVSAGIGNAKNEFVELYNPTSSTLNLKNEGLKIKLVSSTGKVTEKNITWINEIIKPKGFFLFGTGEAGAVFDAQYSSQSLTGIGGVIITDKDDVVIDKAAWGEKPPRAKLPPASASESQGFEIDQSGGMDTNQSMERKAKASSTAESMSNNEDKNTGNSWDSDNNNQDFVLQISPNPQNYSSQEEPELKKDPDSPAPLPVPTPSTETKTYPQEIRISEILPDPKGDDSTLEFIELENYSSQKIDITNWSLEDFKQNVAQSETKHTFTFDKDYCTKKVDTCIIEPQNFLVIYSQDFSSKSLTLNNTSGDSVRFLDPNDKIISNVSYEEKKVKESYAYAFDGNGWQWTSIPTPSEKNQFDIISQSEIPPKEIAPSYSREIRLNEILPNASEEYIELYNIGFQAIDLSGWILRDVSKRGKYIFPENTSVLAKSFLVISKKEFKFALNNSGGESVFLYNPREEIVSSVSYTGSKKDFSYSFDGSLWRWSNFLTPGKENQFTEPLKVKIKKPELVYRDIPASFKADILAPSSDEKTKVVWDFGDGRKSYQKSVRHTYENTGSYEVSVKVSGLEDFLETFFVTVEDFPEIKVRISSFAPNPKGSDAQSEYIEIKNSSKRKINLQNWSIATGWDKLINHPIKKDFVIKSGESKRLTREFSNFTLNNKKSKIELRYPDGETAHSVKYKSAKTIVDDMIYQKNKNKKKWEWIAPEEIEDKETDSAEMVISLEPISTDAPQTEQTEAPISENNLPELVAINLKNPPPAEISGYSQSPEWKEKKERIMSLINSNFAQIAPAKTRVEIINNLLSIKTVRAENENYLFTEPVFQENYILRFARNLGNNINYWLGRVVRNIL